MTNLSNTPATPENDNINPKSSSPWVMLISMLLLISVLILSSAMLMHYALGEKEREANGSAFSFTKLLEKGKALAARPAPKAEEQPIKEETVVAEGPNSSKQGIKRFFPRESQSAVRWPKLKLTGFGKGSGNQSDFAIINGEQILVGSRIDGVILVEILNQGVVVEHKGERKILTVKL